MQVAQVAHAQQAAHLVRAVLVRLVLAHLAQASAHRVPASVAVHLQLAVPALAHLVRVAHQQAVAVVAAALPAHSVRVAHVAPRRPASQSVRSARNTSSGPRLASVAQLCLVATAPLCFASVVVQASKTSQTRSMRAQAS